MGVLRNVENLSTDTLECPRRNMGLGDSTHIAVVGLGRHRLFFRSNTEGRQPHARAGIANHAARWSMRDFIEQAAAA